MKEFILLLKLNKDHFEHRTEAERQTLMNRSKEYVQKLIQNSAFIDTKPLEMDGNILTNYNGVIKDAPMAETKEIIAGYFLIKANSLAEATEIAKGVPVLLEGGKVEIRGVQLLKGINS